MIYYDQNVAVVLNTLEKYRYDKRSLFLAEKCYAEFKTYMENEADALFSWEKGLDWCAKETLKVYRNQFANFICRLADVYEHERVLGAHLRFYGEVPISYREAIDGYLINAAHDFDDNALQRSKSVCLQFCRFLQSNGASRFEEAGYPLLEKYYRYIRESFKSYQEIAGKVSNFLAYLAEHGYCPTGYPLFMHYMEIGKCTSMEDLSPEATRIIESRREKSADFSSDEFYASLPDFMGRLTASGYSKSMIHKMTYYLTLLYLFLEREELGYDKIIADAWIEDIGDHLFGSDTFRKARRALEMYEDYINEGDVIPHHRWKHTVTTYDRLPEWCKLEMDRFLDAKRKEQWASGTIISYRTYVSRFCAFLVSEGLDSFENLTHEMVKAFNLQDEHKTPFGKNLCNRRIRKFLIYLEMKRVTQEGLYYALPHCAAGGERIVEVLSDEDRLRINAYCAEANNPLELRDAAILKIAMTTALRASDIVKLKLSDIDWKNRLFRIVQSKTKIEHIHPMEVETGNAIFRYLRDGRYGKADSERLFIAAHAPYGPVSVTACAGALKRAGASATDFHRLRRTYASDTLKAGATFVETAELLGHTDTSNVHKYTLLDEKRMRLCPLSMEETGLLIEGRYGHD